MSTSTASGCGRDARGGSANLGSLTRASPNPANEGAGAYKLSPPAPRPPGISRPHFVLLAAAAVRCTHETCTQVRFAIDSAVEGAEFEPSVPRDTTKVSGPAHVASAGFPSNGNTARTRTDTAGTPGAFRGTDGSNPVPSRR